MTKSKNTKRALLASMLSIVLCIAMLVGSTFAWFTDSAASGKNRIVAGNLNVGLYYKNASTGDWADANKESVTEPKFFVDKNGEAILWEPGVMAVTQFKVVNEGSLALKYSLATLKADFNAMAGHDLSEVIKFAVIDNDAYAAATAREDILALNPEFQDFTGFTAEGHLLPAAEATETEPSEQIFTVVAYWAPGANDNLYNVNNGQKTDDNADQLSINIEIQLAAAQYTHEEDSFGTDYDANAKFPTLRDATDEATKTVSVYDAQILKELSSAISTGNTYAGYTIKLDADFDFSDEAWKPIGEKNGTKFAGTFDGQGHTVTIAVSAESLAENEADYDGYAGFFGAIESPAVVKNLTVNGTVEGKNAAGIVARMDSGTIENCVSNVTVTGSGKAGGIVCLTNSYGCTISNCTNNGTVNGGTAGTAGGVGGIVAYANRKTVISNCANTAPIGADKDKYVGGIVGYGSGGDSTITNCVNSGEIITGTGTSSAGGIISIATGDWTITGSHNSGTISGSDKTIAGGIIGSMNGKVESCANTAPVSGMFAGGIAGVINSGEIVNCSGGQAAVTSPAMTLGFTGQTYTMSLDENACAGRLLGANGGKGPSWWTKLTIDDENGDSYEGINAVGICGPYTIWANLEVVSGTFYGDPTAGNQTYIKIAEGVNWSDREAGTYTCGGLNEATRITEWTKQP